MKKALTKAQILEAQDLKREIVAVPEWGGDVIVLELSGAEADRLASLAAGDDRRFGMLLLAASLVDEEGAPLFTTEDISELSKKNNRILLSLMKAVNRINLFEAGAAEKN